MYERQAVDGVVLLPDFCHLEIQGMKIRLTRHEYRILELLMRDVKRARTKKEIYEYAWEDDYLGDDKTINVHISNIRSKLHEMCIRDRLCLISSLSSISLPSLFAMVILGSQPS